MNYSSFFEIQRSVVPVGSSRSAPMFDTGEQVIRAPITKLDQFPRTMKLGKTT